MEGVSQDPGSLQTAGRGKAQVLPESLLQGPTERHTALLADPLISDFLPSAL